MTYRPNDLTLDVALDNMHELRSPTSSTCTYDVMSVSTEEDMHMAQWREDAPCLRRVGKRLQRALGSNAVQRVLSACLLAPLVTVFLWFSPAFATATICSFVVSACAYEYSWMVHRIQFRFLALTECPSNAVPGGSMEYFNDFFSKNGDTKDIEQGEEAHQEEPDNEIRHAMNLQDCVITPIANRYFAGAQRFTVVLLAIPVAVAISAVFQALLLLMPPSFRESDFYTFRWLYSLTTDFVCALFALHTPNRRSAFVVLVEKAVFSFITVHSGMCPINELSCGNILSATDICAIGMLIVIIFHISLRKQALHTFVYLFLDLLGFIYLIGTMSVFIGFIDDSRRGLYRKLLITLLYVVWASDTGAYVAGKVLTRVGYTKYHAIAPHVSKNKDYEGTAVAVLWGIGTIFLVSEVIGVSAISIEKSVIAALAVVVGRMGDLFESLIKRAAGIKHSGSLIPGHGGVLDRIDALLFASLVFSRYYTVLIT
ncbi:hypothetical protein Poli38472_011017 [Pythium oligandrum]|uniref:Phosphatidate cytidylyltransferase n=1 Tax=Pythium oligandrum TaxID=41045 RepID=A0A8K1FPZ1_PYTOL|nr:hypothetical protein Poli38472_011017 [Pythium oligandrum]|eukprot:TMW67397.1 hypothetical protein Poli38472_011017 [Pythium oligandrum]